MVRRPGVLVAILLTWTGSASAQDANGHIEGRVLTPDARPAPAVRVAASSPSLQLHQEAETDARGYFRLRAVPVGTYQLRLALVGYRPVVFEGVTVRLGRTTSLGETRLELQVLELGEIVVNAERPLVDLASAASRHQHTLRAIRESPHCARLPLYREPGAPGQPEPPARRRSQRRRRHRARERLLPRRREHHRPAFWGDQLEPTLQLRARAPGQSRRV